MNPTTGVIKASSVSPVLWLPVEGGIKFSFLLDRRGATYDISGVCSFQFSIETYYSAKLYEEPPAGMASGPQH